MMQKKSSAEEFDNPNVESDFNVMLSDLLAKIWFVFFLKYVISAVNVTFLTESLFKNKLNGVIYIRMQRLCIQLETAGKSDSSSC